MPHDLGDTIPLAVTITDTDGEPTAAASVTLTITGPDGPVPATTPNSPAEGRYQFDFVPTTAGLYRVRWVSTGPAAAYEDVLDVRPVAEGAVVSLADAKDHLNKELGRRVDDDELRALIPAAVRRVDRHLYTAAQRAAGATLAAAALLLPEERLAVLTVLVEFWRTQRTNTYGGSAYGGGGASGAALEADSGPAGAAPLTIRLTDLLGPAAGDAAGIPAPIGAFPAPAAWPDPVARPGLARRWYA